MLIVIRQVCAFIGCALSEATHYISKYKLHWPVACILIAVVSYNFGHYRGRIDAQASDVKIQLEQKQANQTAVVNTQETSLALANKFTTINQDKEKQDYELDTKAERLLRNFGPTERVHLKADTKQRLNAARLPAAAETDVVKLPDEWGFSGRDRATLIDQARRADKIAEELKACKASLNSVYEAHEKYQRDMQEYEKKLKQ